MTHLTDYYRANSEIPIDRRPNVIHVAGKYVVFRVIGGMDAWDTKSKATIKLEENSFFLVDHDSDLQGILWVLDGLQQRAAASAHILYSYSEMMNHVNGITTPEE